ncbi:tripartite tricarboxylate transporter TctB family protein [Vibrio anguillarum]|nr:tripartite tricarboxylate transporter TctB family protein [Vibrio anguillarum]MBF4277578.1 tripartite tricarboxylate transporter TctB family protein [Vibrio anguillarum]MBF4300309.1 tripartite tricarboxylate transporter TctB family protein [Vibrio anguillarum]MBF4334235.1 tripartite tricarboxylate transporter TctB family protein [Vibrio anguillarum]MBF4362326.1 tripartite tricarboxylate transporter TctB family protein [Vibrio anguillarum]
MELDMSDLPTKFFSKEYLLCRDRVGALIFLVLSLCYGYQTTQIPMFPGDEYEPFNAQTLPTLLTYAGIGLSLLMLVLGQPDKQSGAVLHFNWKLLIGFLVLMALYGLGLTYLGFVLATSFFLLSGFYILGERRKSVLFGASFPFVIAFYLLLTQGLDIYLEPGVIFTLW